jgi:hypothetical protein
MAGLTRVKTYANKRMETLGALAAAAKDDATFWMIKEAMQYGTDDIKGGTAAWTVVGSSSSAAFNMTGTDLLVAPANIVQGTGSHSWIVLKQPLQGNAPNYLQVCFDWNASTSYYMTLVFSIGAGFTGGSISARPIATDEIIVFSSTSVFDTSTQLGSCGVNCLKSTDGKVTRIVVTKDGVLQTRALWMFEELLNVESYWPSKSVVAVCPSTHVGVNETSNLFSHQGGQHSGRISWSGITTYMLTKEQIYVPTSMQRPDFGGNWPVYPCGLFNDLGALKGKLGDFADLWAVPFNVPNGEYLAASGGGDFQYVAIGGLVFPWVGTPLVLP